jgi:chromosome partitioning protein
MTVYAFWNNKGGVGKSYLSFQVAAEYARTHPNQKVLVIDLCPQSNVSSMLLGGIVKGEEKLENLCSVTPLPRTIAGYIEERISSPYVNPNCGSKYVTQVSPLNEHITDNLYLVCGDERLEIQASRVSSATNPGPAEAWRIVHMWISDLINDIETSWNDTNIRVFIDCNPSFTIYTELAMSAADRLIIPFSADGSSKRAVRAVLALLYGVTRLSGGGRSDFAINMERYRMSSPLIYCYVGNRLTTINLKAASAFKQVVKEIGEEIWAVWKNTPNHFCIHPDGEGAPKNRTTFTRMFQYEVVDANTASVVSGALGIPIMKLTPKNYSLLGKSVTVNQSQLERQQPNIKNLVETIE